MEVGISYETHVPIYQIIRYHIPEDYNKLRGLSPRANYTDQATAACERSDC
jgi:hypothetical protein